jgi:transketolase
LLPTVPVYKKGDAAVGSRKYSEAVIQSLANVIPDLVGGSADLTGSNFTIWKEAKDFQPEGVAAKGGYDGRYIRYGVREHAMGAVMNGLHAYGAIIPFGGTVSLSFSRSPELSQPRFERSSL